MKKIKGDLAISAVSFIVSMFLPSFQGIDTKIFDYIQMDYFELVKAKWWMYLLLLIILILTIILSVEKSRMLSIVFITGFVFLNLSLLSLEHGRLFINGYPLLWGYAVVTFLGLLVSTLLITSSYKHEEKAF